MSEEIKFNVNYYVKVKLTPEGVQIHKDYWANYGIQDPPEEEDQDGFWKFQMWELMKVFGDHVYNGCRVPFETTIYLLPE